MATNKKDRFLRYLVWGPVHSAAGYLLYLGLIRIIPYPVAYSLSYAASVVMSFYVNSRFVFRTEMTWGKAARFPMVYVAQYLTGITLVALLIEYLGVSVSVAPLLVIPATVAVSFFLLHFVLRPDQSTRS